MIPTPVNRGHYQPGPPFPQHAPNAALLIDFDNVTMGIRSDLGKELKALLNSDVIRGKVAVQRAYADWRRYPQYIVPLTERSIDLIFAPAYGSSKKNATDLRMAIDAIELVFTRPEIGTFILMTGDSDFSSCVLKLKEYGKYVIGVGMRESSSDLLIQNCDEYYSYHSLSGLTRSGEEGESKEDPWTLVRRAAQQMVVNGDVMRTDRLKQVMLGLDPAFDEKKLGYSKFSRFVQEASTKGLIRLRKGENGQYEIVAGEDGAEAPPAPEAAPPRDGGRGRGRGRDESRRDRDRRPPREDRPARVEPQEEAAVVAEASAPVADAAPEAEAPRQADEQGMAAAPADLRDAYSLLQEAVRAMTSGGSRAVRDGEVKRRMLTLAPGFDETVLGFSKFTRFLRQAHDAEVIDLNRVNGGNYEVSLPAAGKRLPPPALAASRAPSASASADEAESTPSVEEAPRASSAPSRQPRREESESAPAAAAPAAAPAATVAVPATGGRRGSRRGRGAALEGPPPILPGQAVSVNRPVATEAAPAEPAAADGGEGPEDRAAAKRSRRGGRGRGRGRGAAEAAPAEEPTAQAAEAPAARAAEAEPAAAPAATEAPAAKSRSAGRRGRGRGAAASDGPPPILPGQGVAPPAAEAAAPAETAAEPEAESAPAATKRSRSRSRAKKPAAAEQESGFSAADLGLPQGRDEILSHLTSYRGVGAKTAESLVEAFGDDLFRVMQEQPERIRESLGEGRARTVLERWGNDFASRQRVSPEPAPTANEAEESAATDETGGARTKTRGRRGGRGRGRGRQGGASE